MFARAKLRGYRLSKHTAEYMFCAGGGKAPPEKSRGPVFRVRFFFYKPMRWDISTETRFKSVIAKLPVFHRRIAEEAVVRKAEANAARRNAARVEEADVVSAFFSEVPLAFYSMMIRVLEQSGFDYRKHGLPLSDNAARQAGK